MSELNVLQRILDMTNLSHRVRSSEGASELDHALSFLTSGFPKPPEELGGQIAFEETTRSVVVGPNRLRLEYIRKDDVSALTNIQQIAVHFQRLRGTNISSGPTITMLSNRTFGENLRTVIARAAAPQRVRTAFDQCEIVPIKSPPQSVINYVTEEGSPHHARRLDFMRALLRGSALPTDIHQHVAAWAEAGSPGSLASWLGMSEDEYNFWHHGPANTLRAIAAARKNKTELINESTRLSDGFASAARGADQDNAELADWLRERRADKTDS